MSEAKKIKLYGLILIGFVIIAWLFTFNVFDWRLFDIKLKPNEFGDMFGGLNALFSGLAFAGLIITILLQREDLRAQKEVLELQLDQLDLQKQELADTRKVLKAQQDEMAEQNKTLRKQQFENTLFSMIDVFNDIVNMITHGNGTAIVTGRNAVKNIYDSNAWRLRQHPILNANEWFVGHDANFGPYFRMLYNILKFIENSDVEDKQFYSFVVRDQLSMPEVFFLCLFGMRDDNNKEYKRLIEEYSLLRMLNDDLKLDPQVVNYYSEKAFG